MHELKISHMLEDLPFPLNMPLIWWVIKCAIIGSNFHLKRLPRSSRKGDAGRNFLEEHFLLQKLFSVWKKRDCWLWSCTTYGFSTVVSLWRKTQHPQIRGKKEEQGQEQQMVPLWKGGISADPATDLRVISRPPPLHTPSWHASVDGWGCQEQAAQQ